MKTKNLVLMALLVAVGAALYVVIPSFNGGMKADFMLTMMFIGIFLFPDVRSTFLLGLTTGVLSGLFSTFPMGLFPNIIDKLVAAFAVYALLVVAKKFATSTVGSLLITAIGTLISGSVFLAVALFVLQVSIPGLVNPFTALFVTVVLPAVVLNCVAFFIIKPIVIQIMRRTSFKSVVA